jgi:translation initiation factor IF-2
MATSGCPFPYDPASVTGVAEWPSGGVWAFDGWWKHRASSGRGSGNGSGSGNGGGGGGGGEATKRGATAPCGGQGGEASAR